MDLLNHLLGTCGEFHPNIFTISLLALPLFFMVKSIKNRVKS